MCIYIYISIEGSMEVYREGHIGIYRYIFKRVQGLGVHGCGGALGREAPRTCVACKPTRAPQATFKVEHFLN